MKRDIKKHLKCNVLRVFDTPRLAPYPIRMYGKKIQGRKNTKSKEKMEFLTWEWVAIDTGSNRWMCMFSGIYVYLFPREKLRFSLDIVFFSISRIPSVPIRKSELVLKKLCSGVYKFVCMERKFEIEKSPCLKKKMEFFMWE